METPQVPEEAKPEEQLMTGCVEAAACAVKVRAAETSDVALGPLAVSNAAGAVVGIPEPASQLSTVIENGGSDNPPLTSVALSV